MQYIYKYTDQISGMSYIGRTNDIKARKASHKSDAKHGRKNSHFHNALNKYGEEAFDFEILFECEALEEANQKEIEFIAKYDTFHNGYNKTIGGEVVSDRTGYKHKEETKRKIANSNLGISRGKGVPKNDAHRKAIGDAHRGRTHNWKNGMTKNWLIKQPDGSTIVIENLQQFEDDHNICRNSLRNTIKTKKPHYSGYQVVEGVA